MIQSFLTRASIAFRTTNLAAAVSKRQGRQAVMISESEIKAIRFELTRALRFLAEVEQEGKVVTEPQECQ
jgi:hypothetical protein